MGTQSIVYAFRTLGYTIHSKHFQKIWVHSSYSKASFKTYGYTVQSSTFSEYLGTQFIVHAFRTYGTQFIVNTFRTYGYTIIVYAFRTFGYTIHSTHFQNIWVHNP